MVCGIGFITLMIWLINGWNGVVSQFARAATESPCHEPLSLQHPSFKWNEMIMSDRSRKANVKTYLKSIVETSKKSEHDVCLLRLSMFFSRMWHMPWLCSLLRYGQEPREVSNQVPTRHYMVSSVDAQWGLHPFCNEPAQGPYKCQMARQFGAFRASKKHRAQKGHRMFRFELHRMMATN